ncbi:MAG: ATP cone domain-containing protein, partial [Planctomycetota bacterium]
MRCILKRDGTEVPFDREKIRVAVYKAGASLGVHDEKLSGEVADEVVGILDRSYGSDHPPTVEGIQDVVEEVLIRRGQAKIAKAYILYRAKRAALRERRVGVRTQVAEPI